MTGQRNKAVLWDKMHLMLSSYADRMIHICYEYSGSIREDLFTEALRYMIDRVPVLHSRLERSFFAPCWIECEYEDSDVLTVCDCEDHMAAATEFLLNEIPVENNVQMRFAIFRSGDKCALALLSNHMCMDGGDLFVFLKLLFKRYNSLFAGQPEELEVKCGTRSHIRMYDDLSTSEMIRARSLWRYRGGDYGSTMLPFTKKTENDRKMIIHRELARPDFDRARAYAKEHGATFNDLVIASLFSALYEICELEDDASLTASLAINLRRHLKNGAEHTGFTNHTAWMNCPIDKRGELSEMLISVKTTLDELKADRYIGMYSLPLLSTGFSLLPYGIAEKVALFFYHNPPMSVSNIGSIRSEHYVLGDAQMIGGFTAGTVKHKPQFILTVSAFDQYMSLSSGLYGNDEDEKLVIRLFDTMLRILKEL